MKKVFLTIAATALIAVSVSAQLFVGGSLNFNTYSNSQKAGGTTVDGTSGYNFGINPMVGYYLNDQMAVGASIGLGISGTNDNQNPETTTSGTDFSIAPFFRYHLLELGDIKVFGQAELSLAFESGSRKSSGNSVDYPSYTTIGLGILPGIAYKITDNIDIEASFGGLGFSNRTETDKTSGSEVKTSTTNFGLALHTGLNLGFVYKF